MNRNIRCVHFPYCIIKQENGNYIILNRLYKPLGFISHKWVQYSDYPIEFKFAHLTSRTAQKLSYKNSPDKDNIYLYNDGCNPFYNQTDMEKYMQRLNHLYKLKITHAY